MCRRILTILRELRENTFDPIKTVVSELLESKGNMDKNVIQVNEELRTVSTRSWNLWKNNGEEGKIC